MYFQAPTTAFWLALGDDKQLAALAIVLVMSGLCLLISRILGRTKPTLQKKLKKVLSEKREYVNSHVKAQKVSFFMF